MATKIYSIKEIKEIAVPIAQKHGVASLALFGSYARSKANENSEIDFCIDKGKIHSLFQYFAFVNDLEVALGCHVDVVKTGIEDKVFLKEISKEKIVLYEE